MANELNPKRCCENCEYIKQGEFLGVEIPWCNSKHKVIERPDKRLSALLCMRYKNRRATDGE